MNYDMRWRLTSGPDRKIRRSYETLKSGTVFSADFPVFYNVLCVNTEQLFLKDSKCQWLLRLWNRWHSSQEVFSNDF